MPVTPLQSPDESASESGEPSPPAVATPAPMPAAVKPAPKPLSDDEVERATQLVALLNPERCNEYHQWLHVGMALYNDGKWSKQIDKQMKKIWYDWSVLHSRKRDEYDYDDIVAKWLSFAKPIKGKKYTITSLNT